VPAAGWIRLEARGVGALQSTRSRDMSALVLVVGLFVVLLAVSIALGSPAAV
jgi:hypothetical protein